jgi:hypothetical protein
VTQADPIVGTWHGQDTLDIRFLEDSAAEVIWPEDDGGIVDYVFPRISWVRSGADSYRLAYDWPLSWRRQDEVRIARIHGDELVITDSDGVVSRLRR